MTPMAHIRSSKHSKTLNHVLPSWEMKLLANVMPMGCSDDSQTANRARPMASTLAMKLAMRPLQTFSVVLGMKLLANDAHDT